MTEPNTPSDGRNSSTDRLDVSRRKFVAAAATAAVGAVGVGSAAAIDTDGNGNGIANGGNQTQSLTISLKNVSDGETLMTSADGEAAAQPVPLSPMVYAIHRMDEPVFSDGEPERDNGLEEVAEDGSPGKLVEHLSMRDAVVDSGAVAVPNGADGPGPLTPGNTYEVSTDVSTNGQPLYLSVVTMFVPSNDLFYALGGAGGMTLQKGSQLTSGDVTDRVSLWDAGTEINQEPGVGDHQVQRQRAAGVGDVERGTVAPIADVNGYDYPDVADVLQVIVRPN